jgi:protein-arginine deiminase
MKLLARTFLATGLLVTACGGSAETSIVAPADDPASGTTPGNGTDPGTQGPGNPGETDEIVDLRADTNRDGVIRFDDPADDDGEDVWDSKHGAVFLANIDDDEEKCPKDVDDVELPDCNDAADEVINGAEDALDLARLRT